MRTRRRASRCTAVLFGVSLIVGATSATGATASLASIRFSPSVIFPGTSSQLNGNFCVSADDCWAVGSYGKNGAQLNQALRWNGTKWSLVGTPNPGGTASAAFNVLFGVRCNSSSDCWAVGYYEQGGAELNEALHWNGTKWSLFSTPTPAGTVSGDFNNLLDVWCTSTSSCWAVGEYGEFGGPGEIIFNQALHWNGKKWSYVITPNPGGTAENSASALDAVRCTSATNCWAVGTYGFVGGPEILQNEALHWNGNSWSQVTTPNPGGVNANDFNFLQGLSCASPTSWGRWSLRDRRIPDHLTEPGPALGRRTLVASHHAQPGRYRDRRQQRASRCCLHLFQQLLGRRGLPAASMAVPGSSSTRPSTGTGLLGPWWLRDPGGTANGDANNLKGVRSASASNCWAVGNSQKSGGQQLNEALHWNGTKWLTG